MSKFFTTMSFEQMAAQIAEILNNQNQLLKSHSSTDILYSSTSYFVEVSIDKVVGCVGLDTQTQNIPVIKHLSVLPEWRRRGIGRKLVGMALVACGNIDVMMTIREGNAASMHVALAAGFEPVSAHINKGHNIIRLIRRKSWRA